MLAAARLYLASVQTGYIHPDEFHQSVQVMARKYCVIWGCLGGRRDVCLVDFATFIVEIRIFMLGYMQLYTKHTHTHMDKLFCRF